MKYAGSGPVVKVRHPEQFHDARAAPLTTRSYRPQGFTGMENSELMTRFYKKFLPVASPAGPEELHEFRVLEQFLGRHVKQSGIHDVQCMLIWIEWIRTFRRRTPGFPKLIRENELRSVITETFATEITSKGFRGDVYSGIQFVP
jgi:hypothetical protein